MPAADFDEIRFEEKRNEVPMWLLLSYAVLLCWGIWNLIYYWR
jgi:hypothetical protein